jgi:hypothetical protein
VEIYGKFNLKNLILQPNHAKNVVKCERGENGKNK